MLKLVMASVATAAFAAVAGATSYDTDKFRTSHELTAFEIESGWEEAVDQLEAEARDYCDAPRAKTDASRSEATCEQGVMGAFLTGLNDRATQFQLAHTRH